MCPFKDPAVAKIAQAASGRKYWAAMPSFRKAEYLVAYRLRRMGVKCTRAQGYRSPFDLITTEGRIRIEVKSAEYKVRRKCWSVSIARHRRLIEGKVDWYVIVLSLSGVFHKKHKRIFLIVPSPIRKKMLHISLHSLLGKWYAHVNAWGLIIDAEQGERMPA